MIEYAEDVTADLKQIREHDRRRLLDRMEEQLRHQPTVQTRKRKILVGLQ